MSNKLTIKSITPVVSGWWAKITDNDEAKTEWYSPVAAWALCGVSYEQSTSVHTQILPVLTGESGMEPLHPDEAYCELLYLPDDKFIRMGEPCMYSWAIVKGDGE